MAENNWGSTASAFIVGIGIGTAIGILFAPKSGDETREQITTTVRDCVDDAMAQGRKIQRQALDTYEDVKDRVRDAVDAGGRAYKQTVAGRS